MFSRLREHFGTAGLVVAIVALIAALGGGAYAATGGSGGGDNATASAKGKPGPRGKTGKTGPQGPAGPAGPQGPAGPAGAKGDAGSNGKDGAPGKDGTSPAGTSFIGSKTVGSVTCTEGGIEYKGTTTNLVCNGKEGEPGEPWAVGGTLPSEATETGVFYFKGESKLFQTAPFGWTIPLEPEDAAAITPANIHTVDADGAGTCNGTVKNPTAPPGELCFYRAVGEGSLFTEPFFVVEMAPFDPEAEEFPNAGISPVGGLIYSEETTWVTTSWVQGSFAVTAP